MRTPRCMAVVAVLLLSACAGRLAAKPGVGVGVEHRPDGGRLGLDLGTYETEGAAVEPITGNCPGGVCSIPGAPSRLPTLTVETKVPSVVVWAGVAFALLILGAVAYVVARKVK